jgi:flagellar hook protein FlgE
MSFQQGLSGLNASAKNLDVIGNNVSNANTVGFKGSAAQFSDVFANTSAGGGGASVGIGTSVSVVLQNFSQGNIEVTNNPLDLAINGGGFYRMSNNGTISYSRNGQFQLDKNGYIVNSAGQNLTGYPASVNGLSVTTASPSNLKVSNADLAPSATTKSEVGANFDSRNTALSAAAFNMGDPTTYHGATSMSVYDSLGNAHTLGLYFVKSAPNTWQVFAANDGTQIVGGGANGQVGSVSFSSSGAVTSAPTINLSLPVTTGASNIAMTLDLSSSTQFGSTFGVNTLTQDGYTSGKLTGFSVGADGMVSGRYSNGQSRAQGQVVLSTFTNPQGLTPLGSNQWGESSTSGPPLTGAPGTGNLGVLQSGALESANIDITAELVSMITAQRVYQANAQTIKTQDSVLQTLVNLR